jgi:hypothetical protein
MQRTVEFERIIIGFESVIGVVRVGVQPYNEGGLRLPISASMDVVGGNIIDKSKSNKRYRALCTCVYCVERVVRHGARVTCLYLS